MQLLEFKVLNAIRHSQYKQLAIFMRHNYNLNVTTQDGRNGLFVALDIPDASKRRRMIRFCLDHGIDPLQKENANGYTPLEEAITRRQIDSVQLLLANAGGEINWRSLDSRGRTILHQAVESNCIPILEALVNVMNHYGVSVDIPDVNGLTPYLLAVKLHLRDMAQILINKGHASRQQSDLKTHRNAIDWEIAGIEEHRLIVRDKLRQEIENAMEQGKINNVRKLKAVYYSPLLLPSVNEPTRRDSFLSTTTAAGSHTKTSITINEMFDQLPNGEIPETFVHSEPSAQTFHMENTPPTQSVRSTLPRISNERQHRPTVTLNTLVDLFQVASSFTLSSSRLPMKNENMNTIFDQYARKKSSFIPHHNTLITDKNSRRLLSSTTERRYLSNLAVLRK